MLLFLWKGGFSLSENQLIDFLQVVRKNFRTCSVSVTYILDNLFELKVSPTVKVVNGIFVENEEGCRCQDKHSHSLQAKQPPPIGKSQINYTDNYTGNSSKSINPYAIMYQPTLVTSYKLLRRNLVQIIITFTYAIFPQKP